MPRTRAGAPAVAPPPDHARTLDRICGLAAVAALFEREPSRIRRLFLSPERKREAEAWTRWMAQARRPFRIVEAEELAKVAGTPLHGGICAVAEPRVVPPLDAGALAKAPLALLLDGVGNPHNLGAIARTAAFFGVRDLVLSDDPRQAGLSGAAYRTAEGGLEHLAVWTAVLPRAFEALRPRWRVVASVAEGGVAPDRLPRDRPVLLVLGNEEDGVGAPLIEAADARVTIPGSGRVQSLNVSAAAAVLIAAFTGTVPG